MATAAYKRLHDEVAPEPLLNFSYEKDPAVIFARQPAWQPYGFVQPGASRDPAAPPSDVYCRRWWRWAHRLGAHDADLTLLEVQMQGKPGRAVLIDEVEVEVVRRRPAPRGVHGRCESGGAVASPRRVDVDLDSSPPAVLFAAIGDDYPARHRLRLKLAGPDTETLQISVHTRKCDCQWRLRLHMIVDRMRHVAVLEDNGRPFRTVASRNARHVRWTEGRWQAMSRRDWRRTLPMRWAGFDPPQ